MPSSKSTDSDNLAKTAFIAALQRDYPQFIFKSAQRFSFHPPKTVKYHENEPVPPTYFALLTLHELGHALSGHKDHKTTVERIKMEAEAWKRAKTALETHPEWAKIVKNLAYDEDFAEDQLDSYRDWLHAKSKCPNCGLTRYESDNRWHCPYCDQ